MLASSGPLTSLADIAKAYWPVLASSIAVALATTPICRYIATKFNIVDRPDDWLKPHNKPIPYLGGVAIYCAWAFGIVFGIWWVSRVNPGNAEHPIGLRDTKMLGILIAGTAIMGLGLFDDLRLASPLTKLIGNVIVALMLVSVGLGSDFVASFAAELGVDFSESGQWLGWVYSVPVAIFIVVGCCNATNLLDGLDGLCSGVLGIISLGFLVLAVHMHMHSVWGGDDMRRVIIALAMMGAALGFLPYNRNPATIFMGDAGSMLLGFTAAVMILMFGEAKAVQWMMGAVVVVGLPVADMFLTLMRRWRAQRPLMLGDRSHFYDQLRDRGYSVKQVVVVSYALAAIYAATGCLVPVLLRTRHAVLVFFLLGLVTLYAIGKFRLVRVDSPKHGKSDDA